MEIITLRSCPMCKNEPTMDVITLKKRQIIAIECAVCGLRMHRHIKLADDMPEWAMEDLVNSWNIRKKRKGV